MTMGARGKRVGKGGGDVVGEVLRVVAAVVFGGREERVGVEFETICAH